MIPHEYKRLDVIFEKPSQLVMVIIKVFFTFSL
jgi:hypothetical protein